jgi:hypothetical protein
VSGNAERIGFNGLKALKTENRKNQKEIKMKNKKGK